MNNHPSEKRRHPPVGIIMTVMMAAAIFVSPQAQQSFGGTRTQFPVKMRYGFVVSPPQPAADGSKPWVWYAITINGYPNDKLTWYFDSLVKRGFWICGVDVGESYGNPSGRSTFSSFYDTVMARYHLNAKACLFVQSRGGLQLYNWAADNGNSAKVARIAGVYPVGDLRSYPGLATAATVYGMSVDQLSAVLPLHNPIDRLAPLAAARIKILHIHVSSDQVVPLSANSQVIYDRYTALGGPMRLIVVPGKGHEEVPEFFQSPEVLDFLLEELSVSTAMSKIRNTARNQAPVRKATVSLKGEVVRSAALGSHELNSHRKIRR